MADDRQLVARALDGDLRAFEELVLKHQNGIRAYLAARTDDPHEADDLAQQVFVTAYNKLDTFDPDRPLGAWLRGIALNFWRNHSRKARAELVGGADELDQVMALASDEDFDRTESMLDALRCCVDKLGDHNRQLIRWRYEDGVAVSEITERLKRKHSAVTMMLHRVRKQLKTCVETELRTARD